MKRYRWCQSEPDGCGRHKESNKLLCPIDVFADAMAALWPCATDVPQDGLLDNARKLLNCFCILIVGFLGVFSNTGNYHPDFCQMRFA